MEQRGFSKKRLFKSCILGTWKQSGMSGHGAERCGQGMNPESEARVRSGRTFYTVTWHCFNGSGDI